MEHKKRSGAALLALLMTLSLGLTACGDKTTETPPTPAADSNTEPADPKEPVAPVKLTGAEAVALVIERAPDAGYTGVVVTAFRIGQAGAPDEHRYFVISVKDSAGTEAAQVAVDDISGEVYAYLGDDKIAPFSESPIYDPSTDPTFVWNGQYLFGEQTLDLLQEDPSSCSYTFSDGTTGMARITGNAAISEDGTLTFTFSAQEDQNSLRVGGSHEALNGDYTPAVSDEEAPPKEEAKA